MKLKFKIKKGLIGLSEMYLSDSRVSIKEERDNYENSIKKQINRIIVKTTNKQGKDLKEAWATLANYINKNNFKHYKTLALKKGTKKLTKWFESNDKNIENIAIILHDENLKFDNTLVFFVDYKKTENLEFIDVYLRRIESISWNIRQNNNRIDGKIELDGLVNENEFCNYSKNDMFKLFKYDFIFDDGDYQNDPLQFKEWESFLKHLHKKFDDKKNKTNENDNFVFNYENKTFLVSKNSFDLEKSKYKLYNNLLNKEYESKWKNNEEEIIDDFKNKIEKYKEEKGSLLIKKRKLEIELEDKQNKLDEIQDKLRNENNKLSEKKWKLTSKENDKEKFKNELNKEQKELKQIKDKTKNNENKDIILNKIKQINTNISDLNIKIEKLEKEIKAINTQILELQTEQKNTNKFIENNKKEIKNNENEQKELEKRQKKLEEFINWLERNKYKHNYELISLESNKENDDEHNVQFPNLEEENDFDNMTVFQFVNADYGTIQIIKRMNNAFQNIIKGFYKNPCFYLGIRKLGVDKNIEIIEKHKISKELEEKYHLNEKQISAVNKAINTNSVFYLQGPPGTGKTQTISAISDWIYSQNLSLVMTSSTHEAIANFFDRLSDNNKINPNLIAFKFKTSDKNTKENDEKYSDKNLFRFFKDRMMNFVLGESDNSEKEFEELKEKYDEFVQKYDKNTPSKYKNQLPKSLVLTIFDNFNNEEFKKQFFSDEEGQYLMKPIYDHEQINDKMLQIMNKIIEEDKEYKLFNQVIEYFFKFLKKQKEDLSKIKFEKNENGEFRYLKLVNKYIKDKQNKNDNYETTNLNSLLSEIQKKYKDKYDDNESKWLEYIVQNRLINVIGTTTSSKNEIQIGGQWINLYSEYPIDYMIIDEISKCSMPEVFYRAILAKKVIFAGDYLQLPPSPNLNSDDIINYLIETKYEENKIFSNENKEEDEKNNEEEKKNKYREYINNLYKKSFFAIQVKEVKEKFKKNKSNRPYEFLNESHRFGKEIMDIVNVIYPDDEKLKLPNNERQTKKFKLKINKKNLDASVVLVNLTGIWQKFKDNHIEFKSEIDNKGFDQKGNNIFKYKDKNIKNMNDEGTYNQYSAFVVVDIAKRIIRDNQLDNKSRIAIITLTRNQKNIVNFYINNDDELKQNKKKIVVNTIDNFQGREEDVVIVDFIRGEKQIKNKKLNYIRKRNLDFLKQTERINVALSRAKEKLIIVGWFDYLKKINPTEQKLFSKYYEKLNSDNQGTQQSYIEWNDEEIENE